MVLKLEGSGKISGAVADQLLMNSDGTLKAAVTPLDTADPKSLATLENVFRDGGESQRGMSFIATQAEVNAGADDKKRSRRRSYARASRLLLIRTGISHFLRGSAV